MKKRFIAFVILILIYLSTYGSLNVFTKQLNPPDMPTADNGMLDLSEWDFKEDGRVPLNGEWEYYPYQLLNPDDFVQFENNERTLQYVHVPTFMWTSYEVDGQPMSEFGQATYRLKIKVEDEDMLYGIKTTSFILNAHQLFIDGKLMGSQGTVADEKSAYSPGSLPYVTYFNLERGVHEIVVQVANYDYYAGGGISGAIYFGEQQSISELRDTALMHDWVTISIFGIMGIYFIGIYSQRRKDYYYLLFAIYCMAIALFKAIHGEQVWYIVFPDSSYELVSRLRLLSFMTTHVSLLLYIYTAFKEIASKKIVIAGTAIGGLIMLYEVLFPSLVPVWFLHTTSAYMFVSLTYIVYVMVLATLKKMDGGVFMIIGALAMTVHSLRYYVALESVITLFPIEPFIFLLMLAFLMSLRFSNTFKRNEQLSTELIKVDKVKDEFIAKTSHEFKTPLHGIMNITQSMVKESGSNLSSRENENLQLITSIAKRLSVLVHDILDLSNLKQGELMVNPISIDVRSNVGVILKIYDFEAKEKQIKLINKVRNDLKHVWADEYRFKQIVSNLIDNAIKHTKEGEIEVYAKEIADGFIEISVADSGSGIPEDQLDIIFNAFEQGSTAIKNGQMGVGLGLNIVKELVQLQKGTISVTSEVDKGSVFEFTLPAATSKQMVREDSQIENVKEEVAVSLETPYYSDNKNEYRILVVDDHLPNLKILIDTLEAASYEVIGVTNGKEALTVINENHMDLVITDVMMPEVSGYELCSEIRKTYTLAELPVLMVTAGIHAEDLLAGFQAGANDFLHKPFDLSEMEARVDNLIQMKRSANKVMSLEMAFLQSQIKPHFLFNVLNTIVSLSYTDMDKSRDVTMHLSKFLREGFDFSNTKNLVPFEKELSLVKSFVEIEQSRYQGKINMQYELGENVDFMIPPLIVQPLIENSIRHGILKKSTEGMIQLKVEVYKNEIVIEVSDNGIGMSEEKIKHLLNLETVGSHVGIQNIHQRIKMLFGTELQIESEPNQGTKVAITIPNVKANEVRGND
ncbi:hybrid sensor histidine kinase/response regulator [Chengkuizengella axinellae]|uniref:histidine kinase n=1 Tax=Chengkuizengella axinellae TaxID=3064388 RepID=A0ABT9J1I8_9BACL|nr:ATP-binding protein [Chengkuizengella sp. 2205SS18-9]MDP5275282.1 ATP-binding protein [Chengkuizengella sp. 2205SS18-9]